MKSIKYSIIAILGLILSVTSCTDDLNTLPIDSNEVVGEIAYGKEIGAYKAGLAKIYAGLAISGNKGGDDESDVAGVDGGSQASFLRGLWNLQQLPTDEAHCCWGDEGINDFNTLAWNSTNVFIKGFYYRLYYQINLANEYLRETSDDKLSSRGVDESVRSQIMVFRNDARFMRALSYFYLLDMFRNVPFVTDESVVGKESAPQIMAKDLFNYVESELQGIEGGLLDPFVGYDSKNYGRVTKAAAWSLLSRLYLNAEVYTGTAKYTESITYSNKVLGVGYELEPVYADLFKADNGNSKEMIFPVRYEGEDTQTWGGMTFLLCSTVPSSMQASINAVGAWQGNRARTALQNTFTKMSDYNNDSRYSMLYPNLAANVNIVDPASYTHGIPVVKYSNVNKNGSLPPSNIVYTDFPLFRLGEIYLNYAEAVVRGGSGGSMSTAVSLINELRDRAGAGAIAQADLTTDFLLDEKGREFFFEAQRRTDLVRFDRLTTNTYIWQWKGGIFGGTSVDKRFNVFPIPSDDISTNPNLDQYEGYN
ncbi:RagB/SusD family nutrient uptake outer membrane protein [Dysgonomonas sp. 511]|uniref:RagB/SusD family nutrient uptake outer membrane protein n=1 Tax=Dysgonomonas sp. 511 TaxID=2302930 RepID=UPI0013D37C94|nr:RagB/SusD family nutrient uptake outer membrane protein [Dysgonomonas sp. 511]NDV78242.1 RagB/SusD family nutrient uptake outer membrane protein [Dysgonomonas sp. 511]